MKILIAYDGSECAETALEDLKRAGLPGDVEALVMSTADVFMPPPDDEVETTAYVPQAVKHARERAQGQLDEAAAAAKHASERIKSLFPEWQVRSEALADSPAWALIRTADQWNPDLIVMDVQLPGGLSGLDVTRSLKEDEVLKAIPVIAVTAFAMKGDDKKIRDAGCDAYMPKPISAMRFLESIKGLLH